MRTKLSIPVYFLGFLVNNDDQGIKAQELEELKEAIEGLEFLGTDDSDPYFAWNNDVNTLGGDCQDCIFEVRSPT